MLVSQPYTCVCYVLVYTMEGEAHSDITFTSELEDPASKKYQNISAEFINTVSSIIF